MKIIKTGKKHKIPKSKIKRCRACGTWFKAEANETYTAKSILGLPNTYVDCPNCDFAVHYSEKVVDKGD